MQEDFSVQLKLPRLVFSAAHFITYNDDVCEHLHGHNYHVAVCVHGPLERNQYVFDFVALRNLVQELVDQLDHRTLLPSEHPTIVVERQQEELAVTHGKRRWVFPSEDCVVLPVANTTSEQLARYLGMELLSQLEERYSFQPTRLSLTVDECDGQSATWQCDNSAE